MPFDIMGKRYVTPREIATGAEASLSDDLEIMCAHGKIDR
jgi:hypothetical protein